MATGSEKFPLLLGPKSQTPFLQPLFFFFFLFPAPATLDPSIAGYPSVGGREFAVLPEKTLCADESRLVLGFSVPLSLLRFCMCFHLIPRLASTFATISGSATAF